MGSIKEAISKFFGGKELYDQNDLDLSVAKGAAIYTSNFAQCDNENNFEINLEPPKIKQIRGLKILCMDSDSEEEEVKVVAQPKKAVEEAPPIQLHNPDQANEDEDEDNSEWRIARAVDSDEEVEQQQ